VSAEKQLGEWLAYIEGLHPQAIALGLDRVRTVAERLAIRFDCPVITVSGTNGKGSTCAMLDAMLRAAAYRTALYTSPHLIRFNERVMLSGREADDAVLAAAFVRVEAARLAPKPIELTYFEFTTLAAFLVFMDDAPDCVILEVGLGGRLDAVNIIDADVSILTSVDLDHQDYLGDTREKIGFEKAHIFRAGKPAIITEPRPPQSVIDVGMALGARLLRIGTDFGYAGDKQQWKFWYHPADHKADGKAGDKASEPITRNGLSYPALRGANQLLNAAAALAAIECLRTQLPVPMQAIRQGLLGVEWPGRFQMLPGQPLVILDVAHNPHAAGVLAENLSNIGYAPYTHAVFGMLGDKDVAGVVKLLDGKIDYWHLTSLPGPRGIRAEVLAQALAAARVKGEITQHDTPAHAFAHARERAGESDRILVFGSFLTVTDVMQVLKR
jgi:dihydrofolate synthase / folylpolyglutamate synthase